jgi:N-methylhydantoinase A
MTLDRDRAEAALARLGASLGLDAAGCARGIFEIVNSQMALAMQTHVVERGRDPRRFGLVAFGGAGPVHAYELARRLRIGRVVYPPAAGVASALGFLVAPFGVDLVRTLPGPLAGTDWAGVRARFVEMEAEARDLLGRAGASLAALELERRVDVRYAGQGYAVEVAIPELELGPGLAAPLRTAFEVAYERRFGSHLASASAEALHWRLAARVPVEAGELAFARTEGGDPRKGEREAYFPESGRVGAGVYDRYRLAPGARLDGPVLIEERESTVVVGPSGRVEADKLGNLVLTFDGGGPG